MMNLKRTQYLYPELINPDDVVGPNLPVSFDVWMIGLVEFFFTASVREAVTAASPRKLFEGFGYHDPSMRYKTYGVGFRSKIQRFQDAPTSLGPGDYDVPSASVVIRDPSRPSSSFVTTPRKETKHLQHLGPGEYEPNPFFFTTKKHTLCFQSSAPRIMTNLPGDQEYRTKTEPLIGPGSYESAESRSHVLHKDGTCIFPRSQRFVNLFGPPPASGIIGPGEYETAEHKTQPKDGKSKNSPTKDTLRGAANSGPTLPTLNLPSKASKEAGSKSARDSNRHGRSLSTPRYHTAR